jgi:hypothetical protein
MTSRRQFLRSGLGLLGAAGACLAVPGDGEVGGPEEAAPDGSGAKGMIDKNTDEKIDRGLAYLASNQHADGGFGTGRYTGNTAVTSLGALAFMAGGNQPNRGLYGRHVMRALRFILNHSQAWGATAGFLHNPAGSPHGPMYGHGFATLFLAEASGMVHDARLREELDQKLHRAVDLILRGQNLEGGWRYLPNSTDADLSVTICQIMALRAARNAGITVPKSRVDACVNYVKGCQDRTNGWFRYQKMGGGNAFQGFARTAAGIAALNSAGIYKGPEVEKGLQFLRTARPNVGWGPPDMHYFYGHYYAVQAMYTAGGKYWAEWYPRVRDELLAKQLPDGSWVDQVCQHYATAMACLILQMPNNYLPILQK